MQLRHVMVGVMGEDSPGKAAAILSATDPSAALLENETRSDRGGIAAVEVSQDIADKLDANRQLLIELGFRGTPAIIYKDEQGRVQRLSGMPRGKDLEGGAGPALTRCRHDHATDLSGIRRVCRVQGAAAVPGRT